MKMEKMKLLKARLGKRKLKDWNKTRKMFST
jgi:hypothetical protein